MASLPFRRRSLHGGPRAHGGYAKGLHCIYIANYPPISLYLLEHTMKAYPADAMRASRDISSEGTPNVNDLCKRGIQNGCETFRYCKRHERYFSDW